MNTKRQFLFGLALLMSAFITAIAQPTQLPDIDTTFDPGNLSGVVGPPSVQITEVKGSTVQGSGFQVRVKWSAQRPNTTTLEKFEVRVTVRDSNGQSRSGSQTVASSAREVAIPVQITAKPISFEAQITTFFIPINIVKSEFSSTVSLNKANNFSGSGATGQTTPRPPGDAITKVALAQNTDLKGFDVQWGLRIRTQDVIEKQSTVTGAFTYSQNNQFLTTRTVISTVGAGARQARLTVSPSPISSLANVKIEVAVKVEVIFNLRKRLVTTLAGSFPTQ